MTEIGPAAIAPVPAILVIPVMVVIRGSGLVVVGRVRRRVRVVRVVLIVAVLGIAVIRVLLMVIGRGLVTVVRVVIPVTVGEVVIPVMVVIRGSGLVVVGRVRRRVRVVRVVLIVAVLGIAVIRVLLMVIGRGLTTVVRVVIRVTRAVETPGGRLTRVTPPGVVAVETKRPVVVRVGITNAPGDQAVSLTMISAKLTRVCCPKMSGVT